MSAYPGFTDGDLERQVLDLKGQIRNATMAGKIGRFPMREELARLEAEQKRRNK